MCGHGCHQSADNYVTTMRTRAARRKHGMSLAETFSCPRSARERVRTPFATLRLANTGQRSVCQYYPIPVIGPARSEVSIPELATRLNGQRTGLSVSFIRSRALCILARWFIYLFSSLPDLSSFFCCSRPPGPPWLSNRMTIGRLPGLQ